MLFASVSDLSQMEGENVIASSSSSMEGSTCISNGRSAHEEDAHKPLLPRQCLCAPTTHEGSFRCRLHRSTQPRWPKPPAHSLPPPPTPSKWPQLPPRPGSARARPPLFRASTPNKTVEAQ